MVAVKDATGFMACHLHCDAFRYCRSDKIPHSRSPEVMGLFINLSGKTNRLVPGFVVVTNRFSRGVKYERYNSPALFLFVVLILQ